MFRVEPPETDYDLRFGIAGFPVRVHPFFWLAMIILGSSGMFQGDRGFDQQAGIKLLVWVLTCFISILIHELGHAYMFRVYGIPARIVLYMLGGLAIPDSRGNPWSSPARLRPWSHIAVSAAGPGIQLVLATIVIGFLYAIGGKIRFLGAFPGWYPLVPEGTSDFLYYLIADMVYINVFWALINLLPVFPLDGGQIANELMMMRDPPNGTRRAFQLSFFTALILAIGGLVVMRSVFMLIMFGSLAYSSYMAMRQTGGGGSGGNPW